MEYSPPLKDMMFDLQYLVDLTSLAACQGLEDATLDTAQSVIEEMGRYCRNEVAPLNNRSDKEPSTWHAGTVTTAPGFKKAYRAYCEAGWQGLQHPVQFGGQGLPKIFAALCSEMLNSASMSFALCPLLTDGAIEALMIAGSEEQKNTYLPQLVSGNWSGTMNLTEPQAGSDLSLIRTRAVPQEDNTYRIFGTKIFITYGDHDLTQNIIHMVLARTPNAPPGVKGISLFLVPKFLPGVGGASDKNNDVKCVSIEHKLGIKASPTAVLQFGDEAGATGYLVGQENRGLELMFIMMNAARFAVGLQGIGLSERATQLAVQYARARVQSRDPDGGDAAAPIIRQPDVRRLLLSMRARTEAARAFALVTAASYDLAHHHADDAVRRDHQARYEYCVPIVKGWSTEISVDIASNGIQVHGGMGYIEETGAAQHFRDARILPIYEGTTAIQANDLVGRKTVRDKGVAAYALLDDVEHSIQALEESNHAVLKRIGILLDGASQALRNVVDYIVAEAGSSPKQVYAGSVPYLLLCGTVFGGWQLGRAALVAAELMQKEGQDAQFCAAKIATASFFAEYYLAQAAGQAATIIDGGEAVMALTDDDF